MAVAPLSGCTSLSNDSLRCCNTLSPNFPLPVTVPIRFNRKSCSFRLSTSLSAHSGRRHSVIRLFCSQGQTNASIEEEEDISDTGAQDAESEHVSRLRALLNSYKEAIRDGDSKTITEIEAKICNEEEELVQKVSSLSSEVNSGREKYLRLQADFENFRKRAEKERLNVRSNTQGEVIESLLVMVDSFERAKQQLTLETEKEKQVDASYQGIYKQFVEIMRSLKVAAVPTVGKPFDPSLHEAISREESQEFREGIVTQEFRRGFILGERLLRPAMVKVSAGPGPIEQPKEAKGNVAQPAGAERQ